MTAFTSYAFPATGEPTSRTLSDRLAEIKNVKDFGATGDGVTDDLAAIMDAFNWTTANDRGTIYFPPGAYLVSAPIDFSGVSVISRWRGEMGLSTITGTFADYILKRGILGTTADQAGGFTIEKLTIVNNDPNGGGIRMGNCVNAAIRDCDVTANQGINTAQDDNPIGGNYFGSFEVSIENCHLRPGANTSGSQGIMQFSDGPVTNCTMIGFDVGIKTWGGEGAMVIQACYFERNGVGFMPGVAPLGGQSTVSSFVVAGCKFKDNGTAIYHHGTANGRYFGITIEAAEGAIAGNPQYGIRIDSNAATCTLFAGISVTGQYQVAGIAVAGGEYYQTLNTFAGISSVNTSTLGGVAWEMPATALTADFTACNVAPVFTVSQLPVKFLSITAASWSSGLATITVSPAHGMSPGSGGADIIVSGVTPSGYNGTFINANVTTYNQFTYSVADPGGAASNGSLTAIGVKPSTGLPNVFEGNCFNVSNSNTATWGAPVSGSGGNHTKVRWNGTNLTVIGA